MILVLDRGDRCPFFSVSGWHLGFNSISVSAIHAEKLVIDQSISPYNAPLVLVLLTNTTISAGAANTKKSGMFSLE